jgi:hypothetical protein
MVFTETVLKCVFKYLKNYGMKVKKLKTISGPTESTDLIIQALK